jgi:hypothetical protein
MTITLPYDPVWAPLEWAKLNCPSYITNEAKPGKTKSGLNGWVSDTNIVYYFNDEKDAMMFMLKWS